MRIVDREEFLKLPRGTLYQKHSLTHKYNLDSLCVKGDENTTTDFTCLDFSSPWWSDEMFDKYGGEPINGMFALVDNGDSVALGLDGFGRDGLFDKDQTFAIWEREDVLRFKALIADLPVPTE